jgi:hypothetical protein
MMFCPECEEEFPDKIPTCRDCNVDLVSSLKEDEFPDLAIICTILNEPNAYIIRGFLENENIPCQLENITFHAGPAPVADLMKVRLWARKEDVKRARKLLAEKQGIQVCSVCETEVGFEDDACSHYGEKLI